MYVYLLQYIYILIYVYLCISIYLQCITIEKKCENQKKGDFALFFCGSDDIVQFIPVVQQYYSSTTMVVCAYSSVQSSPRTSPFVDGIRMVEGVLLCMYTVHLYVVCTWYVV